MAHYRAAACFQVGHAEMNDWGKSSAIG